MQVMRLEVMVIDMDGLGAEAVKETLENQKYPNYCISPEVKVIEVREIGAWSDEHPLNQIDTADAEYRRIFETPNSNSTTPPVG